MLEVLKVGEAAGILGPGARDPRWPVVRRESPRGAHVALCSMWLPSLPPGHRMSGFFYIYCDLGLDPKSISYINTECSSFVISKWKDDHT